MVTFLKKKFSVGPIFSFLVLFFVLILGNFSSDIFQVLKFVTKGDDCLSNLQFINPEPGCELYESKLELMSSLQTKLDLQVEEYIRNEKAMRISVFSRDLTSRRFVGVNEAEDFNMASLLKVPLAITYYRVAETFPETLNQKMVYDGVPNLYSRQTFQPENKLVIGDTYSYKDLLFKSLVYSDNSAAAMLLNQIPDGYFDKTLLAIGLSAIKNGEKEDFVTAKSYANVFRILYNSSFLSREYSNEIIEILIQSSFTNGAVKNLPKDVVVAHKFGERTVVDTEAGVIEKRQLHDCGIVYAKKGKEPYTFCIMTEGKNFSDLETIIQEISLFIYQDIID